MTTKQNPDQGAESVGRLQIIPVSFAAACHFVERFHRHLPPPRGHKFSIAVASGDCIVGVAIIGRPISRHRDDGFTLEVTRCCTDGTKNAASKLYAAAWRAARAMGYDNLISYTLKREAGTSLAAAGWRVIGQTKAGVWSRRARPREDIHDTGQKQLWLAPQKKSRLEAG